MPHKLHICHVGDKMAMLHPCAKAGKALEDAGHDIEKNIWGKGKPFGIGTEGSRPELKELSGQEKLPVLELEDGTTIAGSKEIIAWAKANSPAGPAPA